MKPENALELASSGECAFCAYLDGRRPYTIVVQNRKIAILVTREQRGMPHLLVIPIRHVETILDLLDGEAGDLMLGVRQAARAIDEAYRRPGISIWQNNGLAAHQAINHLHFHVAGTLDEGGTNWGEVDELPLSVTDDISRRLQTYLHI